LLNAKQDGLYSAPVPDWKLSERLVRVLDTLDPNPRSFRRRWREARARRDGSALAKLSESADTNALTAIGVANLAEDLRQALQMNARARLLRRGLENHRGNFWVNAALGDALVTADPPAPEEGMRYLTAASALRSDVPFIYITRSRVLHQLGDREGELREARAAVSLAPAFAPAQHELGIVLWDRKRFDEAIRHYRTAVSLDADSEIPRLGLGFALVEKGEIQEALVHLREAVKRNPSSFPALNSLGTALMAKGEVDAAIVSFREALDIAPLFFQARISLASALLKKNDPDGAIRECQLALEKAPKCAQLHIALGALYAMRGEMAKAVRCYRTPVELDPKSVYAYLHLSAFLMRAGDLQGALINAKSAVELDRKSAPAHVALIRVLLKGGNQEEAVRRCREALELFPTEAAVHDAFGTTLYWKCDLETATLCFQRAIELDASTALYYENLGLVLRARGEFDAAAEAFRSAARLTLKGGEGYQLLAETLMELRRYDETITEARKAIERNPNHLAGYITLALALAEQGEFEGAKAELLRGESTLPPLAPQASGVRRAFQTSDHLSKTLRRLPAVLEGKDVPANAVDKLSLGVLCAKFRKETHAATAVRFLSDAFAAEPTYADDKELSPRIGAALCAALAGTGQSEDSAGLDAEAQADLRRQAREWLRTELALLTKDHASRHPITRARVQARLRSWQNTPDLAGVRDPQEMLSLPTDERLAWLAFWGDVDTLQKSP
jgi:tetratricopeptide (TPR) repeat protein